jgi:hypothetical protein
VINKILSYADSINATVTLTPTNDFGENKAKRVKFYKSFRFIENKYLSAFYLAIN